MKIENNHTAENESMLCEPWYSGKKCDCGKSFIHWFGSKWLTDEIIPCPFCNCNFVHPVSVLVYPVKGDTEYEINSKGISVRGSDAAEDQRGISIKIRFQCEDGHIWETEFRFHKGETLIGNVLVREIEADEMLGSELPEVIWRS